MASPEKPWIVVTSGAAHCGVERERQPVEVVVHEVELARAVQRVRDVQRLPHPAVDAGVLGVAVRRHRSSVADVSESGVANRVTSTPRATSPSVSRLVTCSHGP